ncbi:MAG: hypothetical protein M9949_05030 [Candidatus Kapabacteria bacterium]|nr:hypothetical protein [Candidatus Kapabacteria bacterium]
MFRVQLLNHSGEKQYEHSDESYVKVLHMYLDKKRTIREKKQQYLELLYDDIVFARYDLKNGVINRETVNGGSLYKAMYSVEELSEMFGVSTARIEQLRTGTAKTYKDTKYEYAPILVENEHYARFQRRYYYNSEAIKVLRAYFHK